MKPCVVSAILLGLTCVSTVRGDFPGIPGLGSNNPGRQLEARRRFFARLPNAVLISIERDDTATEPKLIVPRSLAGKAKTVAASPQGQHGEAPRPPTFMPVGVALAISFAGVGLCLARGRTVSRKLVLVLAFAGAGGGVLWAQTPRTPVKKKYPAGLPIEGVAVAFTDQGDTIRLILPRRMVSELGADLNAVE